jgi:hypothetical protein
MCSVLRLQPARHSGRPSADNDFVSWSMSRFPRGGDIVFLGRDSVPLVSLHPTCAPPKKRRLPKDGRDIVWGHRYVRLTRQRNVRFLVGMASRGAARPQSLLQTPRAGRARSAQACSSKARGGDGGRQGNQGGEASDHGVGAEGDRSTSVKEEAGGASHKLRLFPTYTLLNGRKLVRLSEVVAAIERSR